MSTQVATTARVHSIAYATDKMLRSMKDIVTGSGLDPDKLLNQWPVLERGVRTWLESGHLSRLTLEVFDPGTDKLVHRWDLDVDYESRDGQIPWADPQEIRYHIEKAGKIAASCGYRFIVTNKDGRPDVEGWSKCDFRSTDGFVRQAIGTAISTEAVGVRAAYYRGSPS